MMTSVDKLRKFRLPEQKFRLPDGSRSIESPWVWRGFLFMTLIALGLCISFLGVGWFFYAAAWGVIAVGWLAISMWLWRKHVLDDNAARRPDRRSGK